jgi:hypothetical protein
MFDWPETKASPHVVCAAGTPFVRQALSREACSVIDVLDTLLGARLPLR